jgi:hypothetical protein
LQGWQREARSVGASRFFYTYAMGDDSEVQTVVTQDDLAGLKQAMQSELMGIKEQIAVLQARASATEAQIARIEPMVEARNSRTEKLVMELQVELRRHTKQFDTHQAEEILNQKNIESKLDILLERTIETAP